MTTFAVITHLHWAGNELFFRVFVRSPFRRFFGSFFKFFIVVLQPLIRGSSFSLVLLFANLAGLFDKTAPETLSPQNSPASSNYSDLFSHCYKRPLITPGSEPGSHRKCRLKKLSLFLAEAQISRVLLRNHVGVDWGTIVRYVLVLVPEAVRLLAEREAVEAETRARKETQLFALQFITNLRDEDKQGSPVNK